LIGAKIGNFRMTDGGSFPQKVNKIISDRIPVLKSPDSAKGVFK
jgi:hypothetical protein